MSDCNRLSVRPGPTRVIPGWAGSDGISCRADGAVRHAGFVCDGIDGGATADSDWTAIQYPRRLARNAAIGGVVDGRPRGCRADGHGLRGSVRSGGWTEGRRRYRSGNGLCSTRLNGAKYAESTS